MRYWTEREFKGRVEPFEVLLEPHLPRIYDLALRMTDDPARAEEILQEFCLQAFSTFHAWKKREAAGPWLYKIALNTIRRALGLDMDAPTDGVDGGYGHSLDASPHPAVQTWTGCTDPEGREIPKQAAAALENAISELPLNLRIVLVARDMDEIPTRDIAEALGLSGFAVRLYLARARLYLVRRVEESLGHPRVA